MRYFCSHLISSLPSSMDRPSCNFLLLLLLHLHLYLYVLQGQQTYLNNDQLDCYNNINSTKGYVCNGVQSSCSAYLTFRSIPPYASPVTIGDLLGVEHPLISSLNNISSFAPIPADTQIIIPINCSCSGGGGGGGRFYTHYSSYTLQREDEDYYTVANITYQGLTTCRVLMDSNPVEGHNLYAGLNVKVPLWCACPTPNQTAYGAKYLVTYMVTWGQSISSIAQMFGVDEQTIYNANRLSDDLIFPFTPLLVPLKTEPSKIQQLLDSPPPARSPIQPLVRSRSSNKWLLVGVGVGAALLLAAISGLLFCFLSRSPPEKSEKVSEEGPKEQFSVRSAIESLTRYKFEDLQRATVSFSEANRIKGSVYRGYFEGSGAAIKITVGDVSREINILKQMSHISIIGLSGFCIHDGNTYLVYEYAENGSLSDKLHLKSKSSTSLTWKQRAQIAYDVADGLNYLHNYTNPPYIHNNLKSSNILLSSSLRAKIANFRLTTTIRGDEDGGIHLTRHVVGTQGYMAPEYIEHGAITPKMDVFAFGVVMLEILSGKEAVEGGQKLLSESITQVLKGDDAREKLKGFMDPCLGLEYPLDLAFSMAELARECVSHDLNDRPDMSKVAMVLTKLLSSSVEWDPSDEFEHSLELLR